LKKGNLKLKFTEERGLFKIPLEVQVERGLMTGEPEKKININTFHERLGHPCHETTKLRAKNMNIELTGKWEECKECQMGKAKQKGCKKVSKNKSTITGERLSIDISYPENHGLDTYRPFNIKTKKIVESRDIKWLGKSPNESDNNQQAEFEDNDFGMAAAINSDPNETKTFKHAWNHDIETEKESWRNAIKNMEKGKVWEINKTNKISKVRNNLENKALKLKKAIYGLVQSARQWWKKFNLEIIKFDFIGNNVDPCLFFKQNSKGKCIITLCVDDSIIAGNKEVVEETLEQLKSVFIVKI
jgi:hypothetical protein